jgi:exopolysaccharide biosynthesis polyprenyl glycosylphosphotransferase
MFLTKRTFILVLIDFLSAMLAWSIFFYFRKVNLEKVEFVADSMFYIGIWCIPVAWVFLYTLQGTYVDVKRIYRIQIFNLTFLASLIGATCLFFAVLLDDEIGGYQYYYESFLTLFFLHFSFTFIPRFLFVSIQVYRIQNRKDHFKTLLLGGSEKAVGIYKEIQSASKSAGNHFVGFVNLNGIDTLLKDELPYLGHVDDLDTILEDLEIEEVVIALESTEHKRLNTIIARFTGSGIRIKVLPDMYDILAGSVKMNNIFGVLLLELSAHKMPVWQKSMKRMMDIFLSILAIIVLIPLYIGLAIAVKSTSTGPIFFFQERIGRNGKRFNIIKFRTMYINAEEQGPQLSSSDDPRITKAGRFMRKLRLDEFPQFFNVLKGEMSLVGPRPERQFYIDQIVQIEPQFLHLTNVRPGITSWGQVKFGYAENVDQMIQRMKFDLLYLKNMSLALDLKILLYTVLVIVKAKGK